MRAIVPTMPVEAVGKVSGVYSITHISSRRVYIGSSSSIRTRLYRHRRELNAGIHQNPRLQRSWTKYGASAFVFKVVEVVECEAHLLEREQFWLDLLDNKFNILLVAGKPAGFKHSPETRKKMSDNARARQSSPESRQAMSESLKKMWANPEIKASKVAAMKDGMHSAAGIARRAKKSKDRMNTPEFKEQASAAMKTMWQNSEYRERISAASKEAWSDPEKRAAQSVKLLEAYRLKAAQAGD